MKNKLMPLIFSFALCGGFLSGLTVSKKGNEVSYSNLAPKGMVAYAASYSSNPTSEPQYATQNSKTFQYLNLGSTLSRYRGDSVKVGIIDSGINYDHEDFMENSAYKTKGTSKYFSYSGTKWVYYGASQHGYNYIDDSLGHGTNVAATVAAAINGVGGLGLAPNVELYVYKVTNSSNGYEFGAIQCALMDAVNLGLDVINMSFQSYEHAVKYGTSSMGASSGCSTILSSYLNNAHDAGITLVGAAGNYNTSEPSYPGSNNHVINVGSLNSSGNGKAGFSNYGSTIDLVAPGYVHVANVGGNSEYKDTQGTSFSAPLVTAAIALYKQKHPTATPDQIESALYASCDPISGTNWAGHGALNVAKLLGVDVTDAPTDIVINNPEVVNEELELEVGGSLTLNYTVNGNGTFDHSVNFYTLSGNSDVVSVNSNGKITAVAPGNDYVLIKSNADSSVYTQVYVTVTSPATPKVLNGISVETAPSQTSYVEGNPFNPSGLVIRRHYTDSTSDTYSYSGHASEFTFNPSTSDSLETSDTSVTISYGGFYCTQVVTVTTKSLSSISIDGYTVQYIKGATFSFDGTATAHYNNGTSSDITSLVSVSSPDMSTTGAKTVTVSYGGKSTSYTIYVQNLTTTDVLTRATTGIGSGSTSYSNWSGKTSNSDAVYAGNSAGGNDSIQLRTSGSDSGIVTTTSGGKCTKVSVVWNSNTSSGRAIEIYGKDSAYTAASELYNSAKQGTHLGTITYGTNTELTITGDYQYIGAKSSGSALYLTSISFTWGNANFNLTGISIKDPSEKVVYEEGDYFDPTGLEITATYDNAPSIDVAYDEYPDDFSFEPDLNTALATSDTSVTVAYKGETVDLPITVNLARVLTSIAVSNQKTTYVEGDEFVKPIVTANYENGSPAVVTNEATFTNYDLTNVGNQTVNVSYTFKGVTKSASYGITVSMGTLSSIAVSGQTTSFVKNGSFSFDGVCTATFENGYQKAVNPTEVTSPDMSTGGVKTITVSFTYNGKTKTTSYDISVNTYRTVMEDQESLLSTITYPSSATPSINPANSVTVTTGGYTTYGSQSLRLGSGSNYGSIIVTASSAAIRKVVVSAKIYGSDTGVTLAIGTASKNITSSYADYTWEFAAATNQIEVRTSGGNKRAYVQSVKIYTMTPTDIGESDDCVGLESFITTYMHMDYTESLGYCKDSEHHYYSSAKAAFNALNTHQRSLFTSNTAYSAEWARLSKWATINGDNLNSSNLLAISNHSSNDLKGIYSKSIIIIVIASSITLTICFNYYLFKKRKH